MKVKKRNGQLEEVNFQKILVRITRESYGLDPNYIEPVNVAKTVIDGLYDGVSTSELDKLAMETAASMTTKHPDYGLLAGRLAVSALHKETPEKFSKCINILHKYVNPETNEPAPLISKEVYEIVKKYAKELDSMIEIERDFNFEYFGFKTLEKSYLLKTYGKPIERPQYLYMRVAVALWKEDLDNVKKTYDLLSLHKMTHATPTLFNAGMPRPQLASCFLTTVEDNLDGIMDNMKDSALISKWAGGIGTSVSKIRAKGSYIRGTNGVSNGIVPYLRTLNNLSLYIDQGGGKRRGSIAVYLDTFHADILDFLDLKKNHGQEDLRARDLFYALWISDLFMKRVENDEMWSLMCPSQCPGLVESYGEEFEKLYTSYEKEGKFKQQIKARKLFEEIIKAQIETGTPYMLYKDSCNIKSNQKNIGIINNSNLCSEILEVSGIVPKKRNGVIEKDEKGNIITEEHIAVCNLASIALPKYVNEDRTYNFEELYDVAKQSIYNLNKVIERNYYPSEKSKNSNETTRPVGLGVQGWHDTLFKMNFNFESLEANKLNREIWETIYFAAIEASCEISEKEGPYEWFEDSPISKGLLQYDLWNETPITNYDWEGLKQRVKKGVRNSLVLCQMPTASSASILGNTEGCEAITSNLYTRRVLSGEFIIINKYLVKDLIEIGLWNDNVRTKIIQGNGSIQHIDILPKNIRDKYKTTWEISQKVVIDQYATRAPFVDQTQSMNLFLPKPNIASVSAMHMYAWKKGLKTGMYYLRQQGASQAIQFASGKSTTLVNQIVEEKRNFSVDVNGKTYTEEEAIACSLDDEDCLVCSS